MLAAWIFAATGSVAGVAQGVLPPAIGLAHSLVAVLVLLEIVEREPRPFLDTYLRAAQVWRGIINLRGPSSTVVDQVIEADLRGGIAGLAEFGSRPYVARAQAELGKWLLATNRVDEAHDLLRAAAGTYRELAADRWLADLPAEFRDTVR